MVFPAKILLFGEYGILLNSKALSIPYPNYSGRLAYFDLSEDHPQQPERLSNGLLKKMTKYLKSARNQFSFLNIKQLEADIRSGLYFDSTIPPGGGLGSSGALSAAIYERYAKDLPLEDKRAIQLQLAAIESCFHGKSSGIDPLTSFLNEPVLLDRKSPIPTAPDLSAFHQQFSLYLISTRASSETGELVTWFLSRCRESSFEEIMVNEYVPLINQTVDAAVKGDPIHLEELLNNYVQFQLNHLDKMIPIAMRKHFEHGTASGEFHLKLCGSGGGGYLLAISSQPEKAESYFKTNQLSYNCVKTNENVQ